MHINSNSNNDSEPLLLHHNRFSLHLSCPSFITRRYASATYAMAQCLSVCLSVTRQCFIKTAKRIITQTTLHGNLRSLFFFLTPKVKIEWRYPQRERQIHLGQKFLRLSTDNSLYLENATRYLHIVSRNANTKFYQ